MSDEIDDTCPACGVLGRLRRGTYEEQVYQCENDDCDVIGYSRPSPPQDPDFTIPEPSDTKTNRGDSS